MKVAILHEMLIKKGGAEKVVEKFMRIFPEAPIYTLIYDENKVGDIFPASKVKVANITQKVYKWTKNQRFCLPFMSMAIESFDFSEYDVVLCSSSGFAHGAITKPETKFIVYYHSPSGYLWHQTNEYKKMIGFDKGLKGYFLNKLFLKFRIWDYIASKRVDIPLIASKVAQKRIIKYYKRNDSKVLYPPVDTKSFMEKTKEYNSKDYYITISALTEWKKVDLIIDKFNKMPDKKLKIVGVGNQEENLKKLVKGNNIEFVGYKSGEDLFKIVGESIGGIFTGVEDFGIAIVECMAAGKAIFGISEGGIKETVLEGITGEFYNNIDGSDFIEKFKIFDNNIKNNVYNEENIKNNALRFSEEEFENKIKEIVYN
ncbi:MAG: glycosyltransferase [Candidatus Gracilibacteria bacterium]|nr:glycosyltransferase [Candidatus Gracilibacteria bacterium]